MTTLSRVFVDLMLFAAMAVAFLAPIQLFLKYRVRRAYQRGDARVYVPHTDPWLPAVVALTGAVLIALLGMIS